MKRKRTHLVIPCISIQIIFLSSLFFFACHTSGLCQAYAAANLAIQHLNSGDGSIVPELAGLDKVRFFVRSYIIASLTYTALMIFSCYILLHILL